MAKILVADDNSNVQKTVALALAGLGVEVVSVNNGEAAVRKLSDFSPDLILADIFMPVRSGYEVCEYVKKDSRFNRVPVVLLVGAFDPLDEREAQRVGADGILKKPFVPPDPLITMVKTLLDRTLGERLVAVTASTPAVVMQGRSGGSAIAEVSAPPLETTEEPPSQEFPSPVERVSFGEGNHPVAFGTLLETPTQGVAAQKTHAIEPVDDEQILISARDATLGDPIFWRNDSQEPEAEPEPSEEVSSGELSPGLEMRPWKLEKDSLPSGDEAVLLQPVEPLELVHEEQDEASASVVDPGSIRLDPAEQSTLTVEANKAEDLAANAIEWMATLPPEQSQEAPEAGPGCDESIPDATDTIDQVESLGHVPDLALISAPVPPEVPLSVPVPVLEQPVALNADKPAVPAIASPASSEPPVSVPQAPDIAVNPSAQSATDTARSIPKDSWADLTASLQSGASQLSTPQHRPESAPATQVPAEVIGSPQLADKTPVPAIASPASLKPPVSVPQEPDIAFNPSAQSATDTARSIPKESWADLAASLQSGASQLSTPQHRPESAPATQVPADVIESPQLAEKTPVPAIASPASFEPPVSASQKPDIAFNPSAQSATDTARSIPKESWADLTASLQSVASQLSTPQHRPESAPATQVPAAVIESSQPALTSPAQEGSPDPGLVEAVVQRVLEKMRPQVVDIITKEFLRPIVQALVHREIEKQ